MSTVGDLLHAGMPPEQWAYAVELARQSGERWRQEFLAEVHPPCADPFHGLSRKRRRRLERRGVRGCPVCS